MAGKVTGKLLDSTCLRKWWKRGGNLAESPDFRPFGLATGGWNPRFGVRFSLCRHTVGAPVCVDFTFGAMSEENEPTTKPQTKYHHGIRRSGTN
jgi:hypothetical protein